MATPYEILSEATGIPISDEAASMMATRYLTAAELAHNRRTLELACASGPGLRILSRAARFVIGGDINAPMLLRAKSHYRGSIPLIQLSAEALPFEDASFDAVLLLEATYYLPEFDRAVSEIARILAPNGLVLFVNANPERSDFIRSPFSYHYHSSEEFRAALERHGLAVEIFGAFPCEASTGETSPLRGYIAPLARRIMEAFGLVPKTLRGRARLKRLMGHRLRPVPNEINEDFAPRAPLVALPRGPVTGYKVIYVVGRRGSV